MKVLVRVQMLGVGRAVSGVRRADAVIPARRSRTLSRGTGSTSIRYVPALLAFGKKRCVCMRARARACVCVCAGMLVEKDSFDWSRLKVFATGLVCRQVNASQLHRYLRGPAPRETQINDMSFLRVALR